MALSSQPTGTVSVAVATADGTAATVLPVTVSFTTSNWKTGQTVTVTGADDDLDNTPDRTTEVGHTASGGDYGSVTGKVPVTVTDDEGTSSFSIGDASVTEGDSGTSDLTFTVTLSPAADMATTVAWATSKETADTAAPGTDYTAGSGTLSFAKGDTSKTVTVKVTGDEVDEADETLTVTLSAASDGLSIGDATATGTITDDDDRGLVFTPTSVTVTEASGTGRTATYTVALSSQPTGAVSVAVATADGTAATVLPVTVSFTTSNWKTGQTVTVTGVDDDLDNTPDRTTEVGHTASGGDYGSVTGKVPVTVTDDEGTSSFSIGDASVTEGDSGTSDLTFTVTLSPAADMATTVAWATSKETADTAAPGTDYTAGSGTLSFAKGDTSKTVTVKVTGDEVDEANETLTVTLSAASDGLSIGDATATGTITDDDDRGLGVHTQPRVTVTEASGTGRTATYAVALSSQPTGGGVGVGGDGRRDGGDGPARDGELHDLELEDGPDGHGDGGGRRPRQHPWTATTEIRHTASGGDYGSISGKVPVTVTDDEGTSSFSIGDASVTEGDSGTADLELHRHPRLRRRTWRRRWRGPPPRRQADTATPGTDYTANSGTLSFAKGDTSKTVTVTVTGDAVDEADETLTLTLSSATGGAGDRRRRRPRGRSRTTMIAGLVFTPDQGHRDRGFRDGPDGHLHGGKLSSQPTAVPCRSSVATADSHGGDGAACDGELHHVELEDGPDGDGHRGGRRSSTTRRTGRRRSGTRRAVATTAR